MTATTCSRCGASLPAVGADPRHPDWCPTCAARAAGEVGPAPVTDTNPAVWTPSFAPAAPLQQAGAPARYLEGLLLGVAAAALMGLAWWGVVATTERQFAYLAVIVGAVVGQAVLIGTRKGGAVPALLAVLASGVAMVASEYFIQRTLGVKAGFDLPLWQGFEFARTLVTEAAKEEPQTLLFWGVGAVAALVSAAPPGRRPVL